MQSSCKSISRSTLLRRTLFALLTALLCLQLYALTQHHHDLSQHSDDCPACNLAADFSDGVPSVASAVVLVALAVAYWLATHSLPVVYPARRLRVRPPAQAPPQV
jgi:hypothetical protein